MALLELIVGFFNMLAEKAIPTSNDPDELKWHRLRLTAVACSAFLGLILCALLALGQIPTVFAGFVRADSFDDFAAQQLDTQIISLRTRQCTAKSADAKTLYWRKISESIAAWQAFSGRQTYPLPACGDL